MNSQNEVSQFLKLANDWSPGELRSNLVFGPSESSGDQIGLCYLDTVFELYSGYHLGQIIEAA